MIFLEDETGALLLEEIERGYGVLREFILKIYRFLSLISTSNEVFEWSYQA